MYVRVYDVYINVTCIRALLYIYIDIIQCVWRRPQPKLSAMQMRRFVSRLNR